MTQSSDNIFDPFDDDGDRPGSPSATYPDPGDPVFRPMTPPHFRDDWPDQENESPDNTPLAITSKIGELEIKANSNSTSGTGTVNYRHRNSSGLNVRPVPVDSVGAQNAATAVVTSDMMDIFNSYQN